MRDFFAERFLLAFARFPNGATPKEVADAAGVDIGHGRRKSVMKTLLKHGLVLRDGVGRYHLTPMGRRHTGKQIRNGRKIGTAVQGAPALPRRAWRLMRMQRQFTMRDLFEMLDIPKKGAAAERMRKYVGNLARAGYVTRLSRTQRIGNGTWWAVYLLVKDTGPINPVWRPQHRELYDPNTGEVVRRKAVVACESTGTPPSARRSHTS